MIDRSIDFLGLELKPTLDALRKINRRYDDMVSVLRKVRMSDFDAVCFVAVAGSGVSGKDAEKLEEDIFEHGLSNCLEPISAYLGVLMNPGGEESESEGKP